MKKVFNTERLILKVLEPREAALVAAYYKRNKTFLEPWEHKKAPGFFDVENHRLTLKLEEEGFLRGDMVRFWIFVKHSDHELPIGSISLTNIIRGVFKSCFLGYKLDYEYEGRGYMTEAIQKVVEVAFKELKLHRIEANIMPRNHKSMRTVEKNGFVNEGLARKYLKINGIWEDHYHMVILNEALE
ncbi:GNAT family N-acetyltransferase [Fusibacter paucivorans]|uniref:GNAT family N-acetyltransferase n=1 Tax=Fusibacter paucivorans TaxID=76009 RepID=A0ABS5PPR5_9FIRM|nr:GNAT family N-acetyltransferase [Fusibacter paucivorans]MBS7527175.1 GNAT family N-acetyltransferase [Fusibacter paucivorans]